ncbi:hypothetical protein [Calycomorphotria hydatis]|uniref:Glycosyltransferase RgtA/B/C/D-like domain-containing protein n=1 Tax=Calycomorphotria hydatis TaxID=2528027 RepID=A0A517T7K6_9PLAN|nr:hypothetical protein [Calycomorphotria hydatis]QDT64353.1 hypothetical protein V22_15870 [Calycomorphotria hydatis]
MNISETETPVEAVSTEPQPVAAAPEVDPNEKLDERALQDRMPDWFKTSPTFVWLTLSVGVVFTYINYCRLWHTDLWGHLSYGRLIAETGGIPSTEPLMPLSRGVEMIDTAWLSQLFAYFAFERFGIDVLPALAGISIAACVALLEYRLYRQTKSLFFALLAAAIFIWTDYRQIFAGTGLLGLFSPVIIRPQMIGLLCFIFTLVIITGRKGLWQWIAIPVLFAFWANTHGSFVMGLGLLGSFAIGQACDVLRRTDRFDLAFKGREFWRLVMLTEVAAAAALLNPYGLRLYAEVLSFGGNSNLEDLIEWRPLTLQMGQGQAAAAVAFLLVVLYRATPRRIRTVEAFLLFGLGGLSLWTSRFLIWWGPIAAYYAALHGHAVWKKYQHSQQRKRKETGPKVIASPTPRRSLWTVVAIGVVWICFALTPIGSTILHGQDPVLPDEMVGAPQEEIDAWLAAERDRHFRRMVSTSTPVAATRHLVNQPPVGQVFNRYEWGDYLLWAGPPELKVFSASHVHLIPEGVWEDQVLISRLRTQWEEVLERYGVNTVVLDNTRDRVMIQFLQDSEDWQETYRDNQATVLRRREPIE